MQNLKNSKGKLIVLSGPSGSGKTTFLKSISGYSKRGFKNGIPPLILEGKTSVYYQDFPLIEFLTCEENVSLVSDGWNDVAEKLGILDKMNSLPSVLSSGEYRRVCLLRTLSTDSDNYVLDEPTSNLDWRNAEVVIDMIFDKISKGKTVVLSTHGKQEMDKFLTSNFCELIELKN